jgi:ComF family protein
MGIGGENSGRGVAQAWVAQGFSPAFTNAANAALAVLIAPACASCVSVLDAPLSGPICPSCWASIPAMPVPWRTPGGVQVLSAAAYDGSLRNIVHAWKFERRQGLARPLARLLHQRCGDALRDIDLVVPVPMTPWRRWLRGFNQADDLAARLDLPRRRALARWRPRRAQAMLHVSERRVNLEGAIAVPRWHRRALEGRRVLLVDDVVTTGATLDACAAALRDAGAAHVSAVTIARTLLKR